MNSNKDAHYEGALLEEINDRLKAIQEGQSSLVTISATVTNLKSDMTEVKSDLKTIKLAITNHSTAIANHEIRLKRLEQPTS